jgi:hypothetical protein
MDAGVVLEYILVGHKKWLLFVSSALNINPIKTKIHLIYI